MGFKQCLLEFSKDGMDQAKWTCPRNKRALVPKALSGHQKPRFKVEGVWCHNVSLHLYLIDSRVPSDSSMVIETLARSVQGVVDTCARKGKPCPDQLLVWVSWM